VPLTIYSTLRGIMSAVVSSGLVAGLGVYGVVAAGLRLLPTIVLVVGLALLGVALFDFPRHARFEEEGIVRVTPLRSQLLRWDDVNAIERARAGLAGRGWRLRPGEKTAEAETPPRDAGLVARLGERRYWLTNVTESAAEYDRLAELIGRVAPHVHLGALPPALDSVPTDLYRRKRRRRK
jgi:hypothetical protein